MRVVVCFVGKNVSSTWERFPRQISKLLRIRVAGEDFGGASSVNVFGSVRSCG